MRSAIPLLFLAAPAADAGVATVRLYGKPVTTIAAGSDLEWMPGTKFTDWPKHLENSHVYVLGGAKTVGRFIKSTGPVKDTWAGGWKYMYYSGSSGREALAMSALGAHNINTRSEDLPTKLNEPGHLGVDSDIPEHRADKTDPEPEPEPELREPEEQGQNKGGTPSLEENVPAEIEVSCDGTCDVFVVQLYCPSVDVSDGGIPAAMQEGGWCRRWPDAAPKFTKDGVTHSMNIWRKQVTLSGPEKIDLTSDAEYTAIIAHAGELGDNSWCDAECAWCKLVKLAGGTAESVKRSTCSHPDAVAPPAGAVTAAPTTAAPTFTMAHPALDADSHKHVYQCDIYKGGECDGMGDGCVTDKGWFSKDSLPNVDAPAFCRSLGYVGVDCAHYGGNWGHVCRSPTHEGVPNLSGGDLSAFGATVTWRCAGAGDDVSCNPAPAPRHPRAGGAAVAAALAGAGARPSPFPAAAAAGHRCECKYYNDGYSYGNCGDGIIFTESACCMSVCTGYKWGVCTSFDGGDGWESHCREETTEEGCNGKWNMYMQEFCQWRPGQPL